MSMRPFGTFPTAYGVAVQVHKDEATFNDEDAHALFSMEATAVCAGIHSLDQRARFVVDAKRIGGMPADLTSYGGGTVRHIPLPRATDPAYEHLPKGVDLDLPIEKWINRLMSVHRWCDRAAILETEILPGNLQNAEEWKLPFGIAELALQIMLTAALENLAEHEIDCLEAAAFYALTIHKSWNAAGRAWLQPYASTWFADWTRERPTYRRFAKMIREGGDNDLPKWLAGGAA